MKAFTGGTVLTASDKGTIDGGTVLVENGKILAVGVNLGVPSDAEVVDCSGKFVSPGFIDCHTHIGVGGDGGESTSPVTPEVRIIDSPALSF